VTQSQAQPTPGTIAELLDSAAWHKSSRSGSDGNCVEVARILPGIVAMRDSKDPDGPKLLVSRMAWAAFIRRVKGEG
jgi:hypothetical protein